MELGLFQPSWEKQVSETETISANEPCWGFVQTPQTLGFFRKNRKLLKIDRNGLSNWTLCSKLQRFRFQVYQAERNRYDSTGNPWESVFSSGTDSICASRQRSYVPRPPLHNGRLFLDFGAIFSQVTLNFLHITIHQVICPSPGTISTHHSWPFRARMQWRVKERAEAGGTSAATVRQAASCHFIQRKFSGVLFCILQVSISTRRFAFAPPFHW